MPTHQEDPMLCSFLFFLSLCLFMWTLSSLSKTARLYNYLLVGSKVFSFLCLLNSSSGVMLLRALLLFDA